jgi:hypothetical protein
MSSYNRSHKKTAHQESSQINDNSASKNPRIRHASDQSHDEVDNTLNSNQARRDTQVNAVSSYQSLLSGMTPAQFYATLQAVAEQQALHPADKNWMRQHEHRQRMMEFLRSTPDVSSKSTQSLAEIAPEEDRDKITEKTAPVKLSLPDYEKLNHSIYLQCAAKLSCHTRRQKAVAPLQRKIVVGTASQRDVQRRDQLTALIIRDNKNQARIDSALNAAVTRRCQIIQLVRKPVMPIRTKHDFLETDKGCFLVTPIGVDPFDLEAVGSWMHSGFDNRQAKVSSPIINFQITMSDGAEHDREWQRYIIRRISRAIGRDPDHHVFAAAHEPNRHAPSKKDGNHIQPHAHVAIRTCDDDGTVWQVKNLHLVVQRELEAVNRERGWNQLTTSAVAKGRQAWWYTPEGSSRMGWTMISKTGRTFTPADSIQAARAVVLEQMPNETWRRPGAGIFVFNAQNSERRVRLRRQDQQKFVAANKDVEALLEMCAQQSIALPQNDDGVIRLRYFSDKGLRVASVEARLAQAVVLRDEAGTAVLAKRILYFSE